MRDCYIGKENIDCGRIAAWLDGEFGGGNGAIAELIGTSIVKRSGNEMNQFEKKDSNDDGERKKECVAMVTNGNKSIQFLISFLFFFP